MPYMTKLKLLIRESVPRFVEKDCSHRTKNAPKDNRIPCAAIIAKKERKRIIQP
jgi:hypothetical protein